MTYSKEIQSKQYTGILQDLGRFVLATKTSSFEDTIHVSLKGTGALVALYIVNAVINFQKSSASFVNSTGLQGGAIALIGSATVIVGP
jgi:hypothetical protein